MRRITTFGLSIVGFLIGWVAVAHAGTDLGTGDNAALSELLRAVVDALSSGNPGLAGALIIIAAVALVRKYGAEKWPWLNKSPGPQLMVLVSAFGAALATALNDGGPIVAALWPAAKLAALAAGGFALVAAIGRAVVDKWGGKLPGWVVSILNLVLWLFAKPGEKTIAAAKKAGDEAVEDSPADGVGPTSSLR